MAHSRWLNFANLTLAVLLPFVSGAAALSHELLWTRRLVDLLGATDWVVGRVLGLFFLGISLGGYLAAQQRSGRISAIYQLVWAELLVGFLALPAAFLPAWTDWIWPTIGTDVLQSWVGALLKFALTALVVLPPSIAMGFTMPLFIKTATDLGGKVSSTGIWIYAINTLGGVFGLWITSVHLLQMYGAQSTMILIALANAAVALALYLIAKLAKQDSKVSNVKLQIETSRDTLVDTDQNKSGAGRAEWPLIILSFVSGLIVLSIEVALFRLIALVVPSSYHTTSALLANVILILAISSTLVSMVGGLHSLRSLNPLADQSFNKWILAGGFLGAAICVCWAPSLLFYQSDQLMSLRYLQGLNGRLIESINHYWTLVFWLVASIGGVALFCSGVVFPAIISLSSKHDPSGDRIGWLLAANGIGGLLGSEISNSILIGSVGIYVAFSWLAVAAMLAGITTLLIWEKKLFAVAAAIVVTAMILVGHQYNRHQPYLSPRTTQKFKIHATHFGNDGVSIVVENDSGSKSILMNNQYILGSTGAALDERRQLLLPWSIHPSAQSVCCLGLATGISASGLEQIPNPPSIAAVELSADVEQIARKHFSTETSGFFEREGNKVVVEDARTFIAASTNQFDIIVADLFRPHGSGEGRLYSIEHFKNVRNALTEDGLFCQWLPIYQLNRENFEVIATTFEKVFPETLVIYENLNARNPVLGLMARKNDKNWNAQELSEHFARIPLSVSENDRLLASPDAFVVGVLKRDVFSQRRVNTLDNLQIEISAGNFWILKDLRKDRKATDPENEFISGNQLFRFNFYLKQVVTPVFPKASFRRFERALRSNEKP